jgi:hypothetical protein
VVTPLLRHGYHQALLLGSVIVLAAAAAAALLRLRAPHDPGLEHATSPRPEEGTS